MKLRLNGADVDVDAHPMKRLLDVLREECELTGTKEGCGEGECGACTVLVDGAPVCSCLIPFAQVEDTKVTTIEGLGEDHPLQHAFMDEVGAQCTTLDTPEMDVVLVENPFPEGPFGAKGLGELPIDGPAPALVNAIRSLGLDVREVPATPELLYSAIGSRRAAERHHARLTYGAG